MLQNNKQTLIEALEPLTQDPGELRRPLRCRAALFDETESSIILIGRSKPGIKPYAVFPGGGLEPTDMTPELGVLREIDEELSLKPEDVAISERVIVHNDEFFYLGRVKEGSKLVLGGPEADRPESVSGIYSPAWFALAGLKEERVRPKAIAHAISTAYDSLQISK